MLQQPLPRIQRGKPWQAVVGQDDVELKRLGGVFEGLQGLDPLNLECLARFGQCPLNQGMVEGRVFKVKDSQRVVVGVFLLHD